MLAHELYLRLAGGNVVPLNDSAHFLTVAADATSFVIVDTIRERRSLTRGGGQVPRTLNTRDRSGMPFVLGVLLQISVRLVPRHWHKAVLFLRSSLD